MKVLFIIMSFLTVTLFGCQKDKNSTANRGPVADTSKVSGKVLNVMINNIIESVDPQIAMDGTSFEIIADITDGLKQMAPDGSVANAIAKSETISDDGLTYTFELRDDAYWSNGDPVTAHDFVFAWQRAIDPATASEYSYMISDIAQIKNAVAIASGKMEPNQLGVRAIDDKTLEVQLTVPVSYFDQLLYFCTFYPINEKFYNKCGDSFATSADTILSNGAFILTEFSPGSKSIKLVKNPTYYDANKISLGGINYSVIDNSLDALNKYNSGTLDIIQLSGDQVAQAKNSSEFKNIGSGYLWYVAPNTQNPYLANLNFRLALTHAIDREQIVNDVVKDGSPATYVPIPSDFAYNSSGKDFTPNLQEFPELCAFDVQKARSYYKTAQQELGMQSFKLVFVADDNEVQIAVATNIKNQLETNLPDLSIELNISPKSKRREAMHKGNFDIGLTRWGPDYADPMTYLGMWITGNENNYGQYSNPEYDAIIADCTDGALCTKPAERWTAMKAAERIILRDAVIYPLYQQSNADMIKSNVKGIAFHSVAVNRIYKETTKN
ncbi:MAG: peptide ABC transporter substrate-binding protein [Treponema sp.]|nr:peptide ABC transporter substrate-binding protein [Treponema sp.]